MEEAFKEQVEAAKDALREGTLDAQRAGALALGAFTILFRLNEWRAQHINRSEAMEQRLEALEMTVDALPQEIKQAVEAGLESHAEEHRKEETAITLAKLGTREKVILAVLALLASGGGLVDILKTIAAVIVAAP